MINLTSVIVTRKLILPGLICLLFITIFANSGFAVSEAAVLFLLISPSPQSNAMGQTYGNVFGTDPMATLQNPASLGLFATDNYIATSFNTPKTSWLPQFAGDMYFYGNSTAIGINLNNIIGLPISYGIGFNKQKFDMGEHVDTGEEGPEPLGASNSAEEARSLSMAFAFDYYVKVSVGYTHKNIKSILVPDATAEINAYDLGFILQVPVGELAQRLNIINYDNLFSFQPYFVPGFYYSVTNIGDKITYIDAAQADPISRNASIGMNLKAGFKYKFRDQILDVFSFSWAREADDLLIKTHADKPSEYVSGLKDISFWDNILRGKANANAITKKGWQYNFANIFTLRYGHYEDIEGKVMLETEGYQINFLQPLKLLIAFGDVASTDGLIYKLFMNFNVEYHKCKYDALGGNPLHGTKFKAYVFSLSQFPLN